MARELARRGVRVTVIERESSPGTVATAASWAWVNANGKTPHVYQRLNMLAMKAWDCVLPGAVRWCGSLVISEGAEQADRGYAVREVSLQEVSELEPCFDVGLEARRTLGWDETKKIFSFEQEGMVEATQVGDVCAVLSLKVVDCRRTA